MRSLNMVFLAVFLFGILNISCEDKKKNGVGLILEKEDHEFKGDSRSDEDEAEIDDPNKGSDLENKNDQSPGSTDLDDDFGSQDDQDIGSTGSDDDPGNQDDQDSVNTGSDDGDDSGGQNDSDPGNGEPVDYDVDSVDPLCGNGTKEMYELCDGGTLSCKNISDAYAAGVAECFDDCGGWNTSTCEREPSCAELPYGKGRVDVKLNYIRSASPSAGDSNGVVSDTAFNGVLGKGTVVLPYYSQGSYYGFVRSENEVKRLEIVDSSVKDEQLGKYETVMLFNPAVVKKGSVDVLYSGEKSVKILVFEMDGGEKKCVQGIGAGTLDIVEAENIVAGGGPLYMEGSLNFYHPSNTPEGDVSGIVGYRVCSPVCAVDDKCGNGEVDEGEVCEKGLTVPCSSIDESYASGVAVCKQDCSGYDVSSCKSGGTNPNFFNVTKCIQAGERCSSKNRCCSGQPCFYGYCY